MDQSGLLVWEHPIPNLSNSSPLPTPTEAQILAMTLGSLQLSKNIPCPSYLSG